MAKKKATRSKGFGGGAVAEIISVLRINVNV